MDFWSGSLPQNQAWKRFYPIIPRIVDPTLSLGFRLLIFKLHNLWKNFHTQNSILHLFMSSFPEITKVSFTTNMRLLGMESDLSKAYLKYDISIIPCHCTLGHIAFRKNFPLTEESLWDVFTQFSVAM